MMDFVMDTPQSEKQFKEILNRIRTLKNGETVAQMKSYGMNYKVNWGASVISLRQLAKQYTPDHLLALKLWNKQWRETMIMATLLEQAEELTEEQMDFWAKSFETSELAEQAVANLFVHSKFAYIKALEWCRGKKHLVRYTGLMLMGRLAMTDKKAIDEMFDPFFDVLLPLSKDPALATAFFRSFILLANRSEQMRQNCILFLGQMERAEEEQAQKQAQILKEELTA